MSIPIFVDKNAEIEISFAIGTSKTKYNFLYCDVNKEELKKVAEDDLNEIEEHKAWFREPNFEDANRIFDKSIDIKDAAFKVNFGDMRLERIVTLIKRWTLGESVSDKNVKDLHPLVAAVIGHQLDLALTERGIG